MKKSIFIMLAIMLSATSIAQTKAITLEDIWSNGTFATGAARVGRSMADGERYSLMNNDGIAVYSYKTGEKLADLMLFADIDALKNIMIDSYKIDDNEQQILLSANFEPIYRRSGVSDYYLYDIANATLRKLTEDGKQRLTTFSPDGRMVAYVRNNNLYVMDLATLRERAITTDGEFNHIINGTTDWVYEEEFSITRGFHFSPDSRRIAYYRFDESNVKEYSMQMWQDLYPSDYTYKYPKAGEDNSKVEIFIYDLQQDRRIVPALGSENDQYLPRFQWTSDPSKLCVMRMNRLQNHMELLLVNADDNTVQTIYDQTNTGNGKSYVVQEALPLTSKRSLYSILNGREGCTRFFDLLLNGGSANTLLKARMGSYTCADYNCSLFDASISNVLRSRL